MGLFYGIFIFNFVTLKTKTLEKIINDDVKKQFLKLFGEHIRKLRCNKNISQIELSRRCYSNVKKIGRTERGEYDFRFTFLIAIAKGLDLTIEQLLNFDYPENIFEIFWIEEPLYFNG